VWILYPLTMNNIFKIMLWTRSLTHFRSTHHTFSRKFSNFSMDPDRGSWESMEGLVHCHANSVPLSPINFLERAAKVCRDRTSLVYGSLKYNWGQTHQRCLKLASSLTQLGISRGDVVSCVTLLHACLSFNFTLTMFRICGFFDSTSLSLSTI
jgi:hypothetical protein